MIFFPLQKCASGSTLGSSDSSFQAHAHCMISPLLFRRGIVASRQVRDLDVDRLHGMHHLGSLVFPFGAGSRGGG